MTRNRFFSLFAVLLFIFPLSASAGLLDLFRSATSSSTSSTSTSTGTSTSTTTSAGSQTVTYTPTNWSTALKGDLYLPSGTQTRPVVLLLHGGAWQRGDKSSMSGTGQALAQRGYAAFSINYRFAPGSTYPAQLQDMQQAVRFLQQHASEYRLDMNRLAVWGYSAGGHLAALLAVQPASDLPPVRVAIAGGAPTDLAAPEARDASSVKIFLGGSYAEIPSVYEQASPRAHVRPGVAPFFLYHGTTDATVPPVQSENFAKVLRANNVPVELMWLQGMDHSQASAASSTYRPAAMAFLDRYINAGQGGSAATPLPSQPVDTTVPSTGSGSTTTPTTSTPTTSTPTTTAPTTTTSTTTYQRLRDFLSR